MLDAIAAENQAIPSNTASSSKNQSNACSALETTAITPAIPVLASSATKWATSPRNARTPID